MMDGLDIDVGLGLILPNRLIFLDKQSHRASPSKVKEAMKP